MPDYLLDDQFQEKESFNTDELNTILKVRNEASDLVSAIRAARTMLFILAGLSGLSIVFILMQNDPISSVVIFSAIIVSIYLFLAVIVPKNPAVALSTVLGLYILLLIMNYLSNPSIDFGILMRILVIYFLVKGVRAAFKLPKKLQELQQLGVPSHWIDTAKKLKELPTTRALR